MRLARIHKRGSVRRRAPSSATAHGRPARADHHEQHRLATLTISLFAEELRELRGPQRCVFAKSASNNSRAESGRSSRWS